MAEPLSTLVPRKQVFEPLDGRDTPAQVAGVGFLDRHGFAGQRGLDDEQVLGGEQPDIAGDHVAGGEFHDVAGDKLLERDFPGLAVAHDGGGDADHGFEFGGGSVGAGFLDEAQRYPQTHHQQHHRAGPQISGGEGQNRQDRQQDHQRVAGGNIEALQPAFVLFAADFVGAVLLQARGGFLFRQAGGRRAEQAQHLGAFLGRRIPGEIGEADVVRSCQIWHRIIQRRPPKDCLSAPVRPSQSRWGAGDLRKAASRGRLTALN